MQLDAHDFAAMDDVQRLAALEAFVTGVLADGKVTPDEVRRFDEIVLALPWGVEPAVLTAMVKGAQQRVAAITTLPEVTDFVASLAARLPSPELRDKVFYTMATVFSADGEVNRLETNVLGLFVVSFGITSDRLAVIKAALTDRPVVPPAPRSVD
ncbi:MAG: TerB family tellurite resistance protein [Myxococcales bacterium]|nr:TerB family tellurite resistance protein [Myxococcales bacterium]